MEEIVVTKEGYNKTGKKKRLSPSKAFGIVDFHPKVLKEKAREFGPVFAHLLQQSIDTDVTLTDCFLANICPPL